MLKVLLSALLALLIGFADTAYAILDVSGVELDTGPVFTVAALVFTALGSLWAIRKIIKTINKS